MWYTKFDLNKRSGSILCPNCTYKFEEQLFYSLEPISCNNCRTPILFMRTRKFIYSFDLKNSPDLFQKIHEELRSKTLKQGYSELLEVSEVFSKEFTEYDLDSTL